MRVLEELALLLVFLVLLGYWAGYFKTLAKAEKERVLALLDDWEAKLTAYECDLNFLFGRYIHHQWRPVACSVRPRRVVCGRSFARVLGRSAGSASKRRCGFLRCP